MLIILTDKTTKKCLPYNKVLKINDKQGTYFTNCLVFFDFKYLEQFGDIIVVNSHSYISARELLLNDGTYTEKEIRLKHNILNLLLRGAFKMKEWVCKKCGTTEIALKYKGHINFAFDEDGYTSVSNEECGDGVDEIWCECGCCGATGADIKDIAEFKEV